MSEKFVYNDFLNWAENTSIVGYSGLPCENKDCISLLSYIQVNPGDTITLKSNDFVFLLYGYSDIGDGYSPDQFFDVNPTGNGIWGNTYTFKEKFVYETGKAGSYPLFIRLVVKKGHNCSEKADFTVANIKKLFSFDITADNSHLIPDNTQIVPSPLFEEYKPFLTSHRGKASAPENSLEAVKEAFNDGLRSFEIDIHITKDNIPVLLHDYTIDRTSNGSGFIKYMTFEEASQYNYNCGKQEYGFVKLVTLSEFLAWCKQNDCLCELDVAGRGFTFKEIKAIYNTVKEADALDIAMFTATPKELKQYMLINENLIVSVSAIWNLDFARDLLANQWQKCALVFASLPISSCTQELTDYIRSLGDNMRAKMWTINKDREELIYKALSMGADVILTEDITEIKQ